MKTNYIALVAFLGLASFSFAQTPVEEPAAPVAPGSPELSAPAIKQEAELMRFSLGLRGGAALNVGKSETSLSGKAGADIFLDMQYAMYWRKSTSKLGFLTGVSFGYIQTGLKIGDAINDQYTVSTSDGVVNYTVQTDAVTEKRQQAMFEIPVMFSLIDDCGVFFNVGPRLVFPMWSRSKVEFDPDKTVVDAYFVKEGVHVTNEKITGNVDADLSGGRADWKAPKFNLLVSAEIGYEFQLKNNDALGLGAYFDWNPNVIRPDAPGIVEVTPPNGSSQSSITINSAKDVYAKKQHSLDFGLKLTYHFRLEKKAKAAEPEVVEAM